MNRSLLLVICDFLLLSLLALANFDSAPADGGSETRIETAAIDAAPGDQDLMAALKISLEEERASREELSDDLTLTQQALLEREDSLAEREARLQAMAADLAEREAERQRLEEERQRLAEERQSLEQKVTQAEAGVETLTRERAAQEEAARQARQRALEMERELRDQLAKLDASQQRLAQLEETRTQAEEANRRLSTELELSENEKRLIRENLQYARQEVTLAREERVRLQNHAQELAQGVSQLARQSSELAQEVRTSQPKTSATIFSEFQDNQIESEFAAHRNVLLGPINRRERPRTILVSDGHQTYALFHIDRTAFNLREVVDWERLTGQIKTPSHTLPIRELSFLSVDPRIVIVPIDSTTAEQFGTKIYPIAREPFRFPEAVLINSDGRYYGESTFTIDADHPRYLKMPRRILSRLFGEFSPSTGDLVFSKTDELIGIMVNRDHCVLIDNFLPAGRLQFGVNPPPTSPILEQMTTRVARLPFHLRN
jgi:hypothetical protein